MNQFKSELTVESFVEQVFELAPDLLEQKYWVIPDFADGTHHVILWCKGPKAGTSQRLQCRLESNNIIGPVHVHLMRDRGKPLEGERLIEQIPVFRRFGHQSLSKGNDRPLKTLTVRSSRKDKAMAPRLYKPGKHKPIESEQNIIPIRKHRQKSLVNLPLQAWEDGQMWHTAEAAPILQKVCGKDGFSYDSLLTALEEEYREGFHWFKRGGIYKVSIHRIVNYPACLLEEE